MDEEAPPLTVAETVLKDVAPELARTVHSFLHGGFLPREGTGTKQNIPAASFKLRALLDDLEAATLRRRDAYHVAVLATAVRLQAVILYVAVRKDYAD